MHLSILYSIVTPHFTKYRKLVGQGPQPTLLQHRLTKLGKMPPEIGFLLMSLQVYRPSISLHTHEFGNLASKF